MSRWTNVLPDDAVQLSIAFFFALFNKESGEPRIIQDKESVGAPRSHR
jgi:hypothetical protein